MEFVRSELNLSDSLTKPVNRKIVEQTSRGMVFCLLQKSKVIVIPPTRMEIP